jgi:hypothetical protein
MRAILHRRGKPVDLALAGWGAAKQIGSRRSSWRTCRRLPSHAHAVAEADRCLLHTVMARTIAEAYRIRREAMQGPFRMRREASA